MLEGRSLVVVVTPLRVRSGDWLDTRPCRPRGRTCDHIPPALVVLDRPGRVLPLCPNKPLDHSRLLCRQIQKKKFNSPISLSSTPQRMDSKHPFEHISLGTFFLNSSGMQDLTMSGKTLSI